LIAEHKQLPLNRSDLIAAGAHAVAVENAAGNFSLPSLSNIEEAASVVKEARPNSAVSVVDPPKAAKRAYPISTFTYAIVPNGAPQADALKAGAARPGPQGWETRASGGR
jgi:phosphate transport system substrate-binding protein